MSPEVRRQIEAFRFEPDQWLWCLHCERFFQGRDARRDGLGGMQGCAFPECDGAGYGVDLFEWDQWPGDNPELLARWPRESELRKGLHAAAWGECSDDGLDDDEDGDDAVARPGEYTRDWTLVDDTFVRNRDLRRRDAILGIPGRAREGDESAFENVDLVALSKLYAERFLSTWDRPEYGPSAFECLYLLARHPELRLYGHATRTDTGESRIVFEGIECNLHGLDEERCAAIAAAFYTFCGDAGRFDEREMWPRAPWAPPTCRDDD